MASGASPVVEPHGTKARRASPLVRVAPSIESATLNGIVRPRLAWNVPPSPNGSTQFALAVCGTTRSTTTAKLADAWFPLASVAVQVTDVVPTGNTLPLAGV